MSDENNDKIQSVENEETIANAMVDNDDNIENGDEKIAASGSSNTHLRRLISNNYIEYSSYVIKERAIPELRDGLKPVQRRILWSLYRMDDGKFHKVANVVGHTMQYHPHGDASIYQALVNLANKEYFIDKQGNFGNILTGDDAAAARYIEARLTPLGREVLFNPEITEFIGSYDGRNKEPVSLPAKVPVLLMVGQEGIAPGMTTTILPHNFKELLDAQIAVLKGKPFKVYPDFLQGGIMDVSEYNDGEGKITLRAKVDIDGRRLLIREIPAYTNTEKLIASIEKAVNKNKIKLASINDYTAEKIEIEIIPARGYNPEKALQALYMYTDCEMSVSSSILVIRDNRPVIMTVTEIIREYTDFLVAYLKAELQLQLDKLNDRFHERTLERIFIENRIYKRIEECETYELVHSEVRSGLKPFLEELKREVIAEDIERLLAIPIRRISKFDINKNKEETEKILAAIAEVEENLRQIIDYTIGYIKGLIKRYASKFPRRTVISELEEIDKSAAALNNIKVGWDRKDCYIGQNVKSDEVVTCNEYDHLICIEKSGEYKIINIPQKSYVGRLYYFNKYSKDNVYSIIYKEKKTGCYYVKRCVVDKFIRDKVYNLVPKGCQLEQLTIRDNSIYECKLSKNPRKKTNKIEADFSQIQMRNPGARGFKLTDRKILKISFKGFAEVVEPEVEEEKIEKPENIVSADKETNISQNSKNPVIEEKKSDNLKTEAVKKEKPDTTEVQKNELNAEDNKKSSDNITADISESEKDKETVENNEEIVDKSSDVSALEEKNTVSDNSDDKEKTQTENDYSEEINSDDIITLEADLEFKKKKNVRTRRTNIPKPEKDENDSEKTVEEDELGIIQPDLGF